MFRLAIFSFTGFLSTLHVSLAMYILSSFIETLVGDVYVGLIYAIGAVVAFIGLLAAPRLVHTFSPLRVAWGVVIFEIVALLTLTYFHTVPEIALPALFAHLALPPLLWYSCDLILKRIIKNNTRTGQIRTIYLSCINLGAVLSQFIMGSVLGDTNAYQLIFFLGALSLIPSILFLSFSVWGLPRMVSSRPYTTMRSTFSCLFGDKNTQRIFAVGLLLQVTFGWLAIYAPLYFHQELGIPWGDLSWVLAAMLVPYVVVEPIIGFLEDRLFAEREFMAIGFLIVGFATMSISFLSGNVITPILVAVMVTTRIGAAFAEAATESYFFKHMGTEDENSFSLFRTLAPISFVIGPLFGTLVLLFLPFSYLFVVFGSIMLLGILLAFSLAPMRATTEGYTFVSPVQSYPPGQVQ